MSLADQQLLDEKLRIVFKLEDDKAESNRDKVGPVFISFLSFPKYFWQCIFDDPEAMEILHAAAQRDPTDLHVANSMLIIWLIYQYIKNISPEESGDPENALNNSEIHYGLNLFAVKPDILKELYGIGNTYEGGKKYCEEIIWSVMIGDSLGTRKLSQEIGTRNLQKAFALQMQRVKDALNNTQ